MLYCCCLGLGYGSLIQPALGVVMQLFAIVWRMFRPKLTPAPVLQDRTNWSFDHVPSYVNPTNRLEAVCQRVQKARASRPRRDRSAADACVTRYLAARREELFHRPPRAA